MYCDLVVKIFTLADTQAAPALHASQAALGAKLAKRPSLAEVKGKKIVMGAIYKSEDSNSEFSKIK